jgi:hypothetical protein
VVVFDCTDRPDLGYKSPTLRVIEDDGSLVLQGVILSADGRHLAEKIAAGLGVACEWIGAPAAKPAPAAKFEPIPLKLRDGMLFDV